MAASFLNCVYLDVKAEAVRSTSLRTFFSAPRLRSQMTQAGRYLVTCMVQLEEQSPLPFRVPA
ncbi:MAG TPA: hypothetical protein VGC79_32405, partial [Polyangiaceae bacterium]